MTEDVQWRAKFDAEVTFSNGGGLQAQDFRLDLPAEPGLPEKVSEERVGELFVRHLGLLLVESVQISGLEVIEEAHKGSRGVHTAPEPIELSHVITDGMVTYPGLPAPRITDHLTREDSRKSYAPGTEFHIARIDMVANTGTYLDSPFHRYGDGLDLAGLPLSRLVDLEGVVIRVHPAERAIGIADLEGHEVAGKAVLLQTGWDRHFGTPAYSAGHPYLSAEAAAWLAERQPALVGIDSLNIDEVLPGGERPAHSIFLAAGIPLVEHLRGLEQLPPQGFRFFAAPPAVEGMGTFPVRAYALLEN